MFQEIVCSTLKLNYEIILFTIDCLINDLIAYLVNYLLSDQMKNVNAKYFQVHTLTQGENALRLTILKYEVYYDGAR